MFARIRCADRSETKAVGARSAGACVVKPTQIARQFGLSQSDLRKALAGYESTGR
jgi:hypothetical protein